MELERLTIGAACVAMCMVGCVGDAPVTPADGGADATADVAVADAGPLDGGSDASGPDGGLDAAAEAGLDASADSGPDAGLSSDAIVAAYAWANDSTSASYTPTAGYAYNSAGGAITISRSGTGVYAVKFASLVLTSVGDVQVTAYGSSDHCNVTGWATDSVQLACYSPSGSLADTQYTVAVMLASGTTLAHPVAYALANDKTSASYTPDTSFSYNAGGSMTAARSATGTYTMKFSGLSLSGGDVQVSAFASAASCGVSSWGGDTVGVRCVDASGALVDSEYAVTVIQNGVATSAQVVAYAYADQPTLASYGPSNTYAYNATKKGISATRSGTGTYSMSFTGLSLATGSVKVSAHGAGGTHCNVAAWGGTVVAVKCYDASNALVDSRYTVAVMQ